MKVRLFYLPMALVVALSLVAVAVAPMPGTVEAQSELHVVPFTLSSSGTGSAQWTTGDFHTGSYSVELATSSPPDYAGVGFSPVAGLGGYDGTLDSMTSLSFWYKHSTYAGWCGPRISLMVVSGMQDYMAVTGCAVNSTGWKQADAISGVKDTDWYTAGTGNQIWWYGTWDGVDPATYVQVDGPIDFGTLQTALTGATVQSAAVYMGVVDGSSVLAGSACVDDPEVNGVTYHGRIQDALDAASGGDTITVYPGTYEENIVIDKSITLQSTGDIGNTTICGDGTTPAVTVVGASPFSGTAVVQGFNVTADNTNAYGINVSGLASGGTVNIGGSELGNLIHGNSHGIHVGGVDATSEVTILHNAIFGNAIDGVNFGVGMSPMDGTAVIQENYIGAIYLYDPVFMPVPLVGDGNGAHGIHMYQVGANGTATIYGNTIADNLSDGIHIVSVCGEVQMTENSVSEWEYWYDETYNLTVEGNHDDGIEVCDVDSDATLNIEHNMIAENEQDGIDLGGAGSIAGNVTITNNRVGAYTYYPDQYGQPGPPHPFAGNGGHGIYVDATIDAPGSVTIMSNTVSENGSPASGIHVDGVVDGGLYFGGNTIGAWEDGDGGVYGGNAGAGVYLGSDVSGAYMIANIIRGNDHGIFILGDYSYIIGNEITDNTAAPFSGIHLTADAEDNTIYCNNISGNSGSGGYGVYSEGGALVDAECNWWGDATGPTHASNPGGTGDEVSNNVDFDPWLVEPAIGPYTLTVTSAGCCPIEVTGLPGPDQTVAAGTTEVFDDLYCCNTVTVTADDSGYLCNFASWSDGGNKTHDILVNGDKAVTAYCHYSSPPGPGPTPTPLPTPEPTPTPEATPTPAPEGTPTPGPTPTPGATPTPEATPTPAVTPTPAATPTPAPTPTPTPTPTPAPQGLTGEDTVPPGGGTVSTDDGRVTLDFEDGAFDDDADVEIEPVDCDAAPEGFRMGDTCFRITATVDGEEVTELGADVTVCIEYSSADLAAAGGDPTLLTIAYYNEDTDEWEDLPTTVDTDAGIACATTSHLSEWALLAEEQEEEAGWQWWYTLLIVVGIIGIAAVVVALFLRGGRRGPSGRVPEYEEEDEEMLEPV